MASIQEVKDLTDAIERITKVLKGNGERMEAVGELKEARTEFKEGMTMLKEAAERAMKAVEDAEEREKEEAELKEFFNYMKSKKDEKPYPKYLYRAHVHGRHEHTGEFCDTFGADLHLWQESIGELSLEYAVNDFATTDIILCELSWHLNKDVNRVSAWERGSEPPKTRLISLSDNFPWTAQRICRVGRNTTEEQRPGLAIFETANIEPWGSYLFRVSDLLSYLDQSKWASDIVISANPRRWADNCGEYVCYSMIPNEALVAFVPLDMLCQRNDKVPERFLRDEFTQSVYLGDFRRVAKKGLSQEAYAERVSKFLQNILDCVPPYYDAEQLDAVELNRVWFTETIDTFGYYIWSLNEDDMREVVVGLVKEEARWRRAKQAVDHNAPSNLDVTVAIRMRLSELSINSRQGTA